MERLPRDVRHRSHVDGGGQLRQRVDAVQTISVVDEEGPWFTFVPEDYTAECDEELVYEMPTAEDHCSEFTIEVATDTLPGPCAGNYVILREFIATDACGNV